MHIHELHQLSLLIVETGDCFMIRRTMQRLESGELTLQEAIVLLRSLGTADPRAASTFSESASLAMVPRIMAIGTSTYRGEVHSAAD